MARLLCDGASISRPSEATRQTALLLHNMGLIDPVEQHYVRCADPQDSDFRWTSNRSCPGRIYLYGGLDETGHDYRCPECERPVFPARSGKGRHVELRVRVCPEGIHRYVGEQVAAARYVRELCRGMFRVEIGTDSAHLCVAEVCGDERYLARDWAHHQPTLYAVIDERSSTERFLAEDWLATLAMADLVSGQVNLIDKLRDVARRGAPSTLANVSIPVYRTGSPLIGVHNTNANWTRQADATGAAPVQVSDGSPGTEAISSLISRLKEMERHILIALGERRVLGLDAKSLPGQEQLAKWAGYDCDTTFKTALSTLRKTGLIDNGRHHGRRGGYFLTTKGAEAADFLAKS